MKLMLAQAESDGFSYHTLPALELIPDFIHGFTGRQPGLEDLPACEARNLQFLSSLGIAAPQVGLLEQFHSAEVLVIGPDEKWSGWPGRLGRGDGVVAQSPGLFPVIRTADCIPVIAVAPERRVVGLFHAGWRGLRAGIVARGIRLVEAAAGGASEGVIAAIGPCIRRCCYEVGDELIRSFVEAGYRRESVVSGRCLDLPAIARFQALEAGVRDWIDSGVCCACEIDKFYSFRKEGTPLRNWTFAGFRPA